jgi:hypothetical protein
MNSQQGKRYIKNRWGDDLKDKILEHNGIKLATQGLFLFREPVIVAIGEVFANSKPMHIVVNMRVNNIVDVIVDTVADKYQGNDSHTYILTSFQRAITFLFFPSQIVT